MRKTGKGWYRVATYGSKELAQKRADAIRGNFHHCIVEKGSTGAAWNRKRTCYRVWVK